jgi:putative DNA methylase
MKMPSPKPRLIETDAFPFVFLSRLAERESWRKEIHRPIYHVHKWWANRLGSVFRGILLGSALPEEADFEAEFYRKHDHRDKVVFDPFMGSGTTIGEAHKLGMTALGRDINPVAVEAVCTAFGPMDRRSLHQAFETLSETVGRRIRDLYASTDSRGRRCDVLYYFWVMQACCPECEKMVDLFPSFVIARNANPNRRPQIQIVCPKCGDIFPGTRGDGSVTCGGCRHVFDPANGPAAGARATCPLCGARFVILRAVGNQKTRPRFRLYGKLVLTRGGNKEYLPATSDDHDAYQECSRQLRRSLKDGSVTLPDLVLEHGHNTRQAMNYGFVNWRDFFNDRHLLTLGWLHAEISRIPDSATRRPLLTLFSGVLEFNNLFASYKGEGTGAVRHMFSHHILKPERTPIEANPWGTAKSSGAFCNLFRSRLLRAIEYREAPTEINGRSGRARVCSEPIEGKASDRWPSQGPLGHREIYLSCGDSATTGLPAGSVDSVITDPPFFDNVHYSELADFFFAWQRLHSGSPPTELATTRQAAEVQDADAQRFAAKLQAVFRECHRVLKDEGLLVFSYHHSRDEGWQSLAEAILGAGFAVVNSHPVKAEMSVATPKSQAKEPIQLDIILVCRKRSSCTKFPAACVQESLSRARAKILRLAGEGFSLSRNDRKIVFFGQLLTAISAPSEMPSVAEHVLLELNRPAGPHRRRKDFQQGLLFEER